VAANKLEVIAEPGEPTIVTRRSVDAPRALVFDLFTKPEHLKRWLGPHRLTMVECQIDLRVGGSYRWLFRAPDGQQFGFHGEFREIVRPERIVQTFVFEPFPNAVVIDTLTLEEKDGRTLVTTHSVHPTVKDRDMHLQNGMEHGMVEGYEKLDELLAAAQR
jgi:uncharacterized protein YndB with AHSA1/START domain